jgi:hypothetical protein
MSESGRTQTQNAHALLFCEELAPGILTYRSGELLLKLKRSTRKKITDNSRFHGVFWGENYD